MDINTLKKGINSDDALRISRQFNAKFDNWPLDDIDEKVIEFISCHNGVSIYTLLKNIPFSMRAMIRKLERLNEIGKINCSIVDGEKMWFLSMTTEDKLGD